MELAFSRSVVVVGGPDPLLQAVRTAASVPTDANVEICELPDAANTVSRTRPFAVVVHEPVYAFDTSEFDALVRDVGATLIVVDTDGKHQSQLEKSLIPKITRAFRDYHA